MNLAARVQDGKCFVQRKSGKFLHMEQEELFECCYDWQIGNLKLNAEQLVQERNYIKLGWDIFGRMEKDWDIRVNVKTL